MALEVPTAISATGREAMMDRVRNGVFSEKNQRRIAVGTVTVLPGFSAMSLTSGILSVFSGDSGTNVFGGGLAAVTMVVVATSISVCLLICPRVFGSVGELLLRLEQDRDCRHHVEKLVSNRPFVHQAVSITLSLSVHRVVTGAYGVVPVGSFHPTEKR